MGFVLFLVLGVIIVVAGSSSKTKDTDKERGSAAHGKKQSGGSWFSGSHRDSKKCNGDCDNCPAHYGYRYGRWYYGHGHQHGCERGGNGGATGRTYRD